MSTHTVMTNQPAKSCHGFNEQVKHHLPLGLVPIAVETVQANIGLTCNLACRHCHVESSPVRKERMSWETMVDVLHAARLANAKHLDITGGAPEMHPQFREFVEHAVRQGLRVIVRTNLTILLHPNHVTLPEFLAEHGVHLIASLPCYLEENVDRQRGKNVFSASIGAIRRLNELGYGKDSRLVLDLVYNPLGPQLPPSQQTLEPAYKKELLNRFGIVFNRLIAITNMPIGRFQDDLERQGKAADFHTLLRDSFNPATLDGLMCRNQLHVSWDGTVHDCDFNYALGLPAKRTKTHVRDFNMAEYLSRAIVTAKHCYGCTAGNGSSCQGSLT